MFLHRYAIFNISRGFHCKPESIVIAAAARTPWGKYQGQLTSVSAWKLGQIAVDAAVKQSTIPVEQIQQIFMNEEATPLQENHENSFNFSNFLKKAKYTSINVGKDDESKAISLVKAIESLKSQQQVAVVVGGLESATKDASITKKVSSETVDNETVAKNFHKYLEMQTEAVFDSEIVSLSIQQQDGTRRIVKEITQDEVLMQTSGSYQCSDGAAALVLTTFANAQQLDLSPLAVIMDFEYLRNTSANTLSHSQGCVEKLFSKIGLDPQKIQHWEIEDSFPQLVVFLRDHFKLNLELLNPHGGSSIWGHLSAVSLVRLLTHLTHSLHPLEYGCVIFSSVRESLALIVQKLPLPSIPDRMPLVTLYTKDPCPLCEVLVEELELHFAGEYELEKVFIDTKDNLRFLRLYRLDIPVVFLNKQFLCMHRLNHRLLRKRLNSLKIIKS